MNLLKKYIPGYVLLFTVLSWGCNFFTYYFSRLIAAGKPHISMVTAFDEATPLIPWMVIIYLGCYVFWVFNYYLVYYSDYKQGKSFLIAHIFGEVIAFFFFIFLPTTMVRPELAGTDIFEKILLFVYHVDPANNLFPSLHCYTSWMCWIGVRKNPVIPGWYRTLSLFIALCICVCVLTVKQHVIADVFSGILLAEFSYQLICFLKK